MHESNLWQNTDARFDFWLKSSERFRKSQCDASVAGSFFEVRNRISYSLVAESRTHYGRTVIDRRKVCRTIEIWRIVLVKKKILDKN